MDELYYYLIIKIAWFLFYVMSVCFKILGQNGNILGIQATFIYNANLHGKCELYYENGLSPPGEREKVELCSTHSVDGISSSDDASTVVGGLVEMVTVDVPQVQPTRPPSRAETTRRSGNAMSAVYGGQTTRPPVSGIPALVPSAYSLKTGKYDVV
jgi:hypothetical protein